MLARGRRSRGPDSVDPLVRARLVHRGAVAGVDGEALRRRGRGSEAQAGDQGDEQQRPHQEDRSPHVRSLCAAMGAVTFSNRPRSDRDATAPHRRRCHRASARLRRSGCCRSTASTRSEGATSPGRAPRSRSSIRWLPHRADCSSRPRRQRGARHHPDLVGRRGRRRPVDRQDRPGAALRRPSKLAGRPDQDGRGDRGQRPVPPRRQGGVTDPSKPSARQRRHQQADVTHRNAAGAGVGQEVGDDPREPRSHHAPGVARLDEHSDPGDCREDPV